MKNAISLNPYMIMKNIFVENIVVFSQNPPGKGTVLEQVCNPHTRTMRNRKGVTLKKTEIKAALKANLINFWCFKHQIHLESWLFRPRKKKQPCSTGATDRFFLPF